MHLIQGIALPGTPVALQLRKTSSRESWRNLVHDKGIEVTWKKREEMLLKISMWHFIDD